MSKLVSESALESRARRAAKRDGYRAIKSRRYDPLRNHGQFMVVDERNIACLGFNYDASAEEVIEFFKPE